MVGIGHSIRSLLGLMALLLAITAYPVAAEIYSTPLLREAEGLVDIIPQQSKEITSNYLANRRLKVETNTNMTNRDGNADTRSPTTSVEALKILAKAEFNLANYTDANLRLEEAIALTEAHNLPLLNIDTRVLLTHLIWLKDGDALKASASLDKLREDYQVIRNSEQFAKGINYRLTMFEAELASAENDLEKAQALYDAIKPFVDRSNNPRMFIEFHTTVGQHYLEHRLYNRSLSSLLMAYWKAIEENSSAQLAIVNNHLAELFYERKVLDKALNHLSQAADFYDNYQASPQLIKLLKMMGDVYYQQGRYNLALVHYFNVLDQERNGSNVENVIEIRLALSEAYLHLYNYSLSEQYLNRAQELLKYTDLPDMQGRALLLNAGLAYHQNDNSAVITYAEQALDIGEQHDNLELEADAHMLLHMGYERLMSYDYALLHLKRYNRINAILQESLNLINEEAFRQQKEFVEKTLHLEGQQEELQDTQLDLTTYRRVTIGLMITLMLILIWFSRRGVVLQRQKQQLSVLNRELFRHTRSGLGNLRMLNKRLPPSHKGLTEWHVGELIHEPLSDRLHFVLIDVPLLRNLYLQHGYEAGLKLEQAFGAYLSTKVKNPARIYHYSDANLLYIEPKGHPEQSPEDLFNKVQSWIDDFEPNLDLNRTVRMGIADYPFLPRAYTAVDDKELLDILLMSASLARNISIQEQSSQWVYFKAIENAPAASMGRGNVRNACLTAINQGLIKVHSSCQNEDSLKKTLNNQ
ncbi:tetratricopeptide repeat protein [Vibrio sp. WXL103]|uniref:tetratricopeptide repeat protein n=1 Tax=unclassified Vibrio TaxID=2614977 RepID=UPI003EC58B14